MEKVLWLEYQKLTKLFFIQDTDYSQNLLFHLIKLTGILYVGFIRIKQSGHGYTTGTFSAREVWEAAENHTSGVLGKPGRWAQTEQDVEQLANEIFAKHFS